MTAVPNSDVVPFEKAPPLRRVRLRASDADRQATVRRLQDGLARGAITFDEAGDRMSAAWAARYAADLGPLTADLPPVAEARPAPGWAELFRLTVAQLRASLATVFPGGPHAVRGRLAVVVAFLVLLSLLVLAGAAAHALFDGDGFSGFGGWHHHPSFDGS